MKTTRVVLAMMLVASGRLAGARAAGQSTDQPIWRATHGPLLSVTRAVTRAGTRLVATGDRGIILLSDDQGATWSISPSHTDELLTDAVFPGGSDGWVVGQDATILHSADAGAHWSVQTTTAGNDQALFSVVSLQGGHLVATGAYALMLETQDGGGHWAQVKLPNLDEDYHLNCVLGRGDDLMVIGEAGHAFVRHDATWTAMPVPYEGSQFGCLTGRNGAVYSFGLRGSLFVSATPGAAWRRIETGEQRSIFGGTVLASGRLALVGSNGLAMEFDPQTGKQRVLPPPTGATLSGVAETAAGKWVVVGDDGVHVVDPDAAQGGELTQ